MDALRLALADHQITLQGAATSPDPAFYYAVYTQTSHSCCIRVYPESASGWEEYSTLSRFQHPNILQPLDAFEYSDGLVLVTEPFQQTLLQDICNRGKERYYWKEEELWQVIHGLIQAFAYMEGESLSHRDVNPANIVLNSQKIPKISGFYASKWVLFPIEHTLIGTPYYLSPILRLAWANSTPNVLHNAYKSDVYSLGMTLLVATSLEFPEIMLSSQREAGLNGAIQALICSNRLKYLLSCMLAEDEAKRPTFRDISGWLNSSDAPERLSAGENAPQEDFKASEIVNSEVAPGNESDLLVNFRARAQPSSASLAADPIAKSCVCSRCSLL